MAPGSNGSGSSYTDDDLLASLASFGVEGQTERDLATIKAMFAASSTAGNHHNGSLTDPSRFNQAAAGYAGAWAIPQQQQNWQQYQYQQQQPPPNTPTFSKSLELQGGNFDNNGFYPNGPYFDLSNGHHSGSSNKRRDVSLDRDYLRSLQNSGDGQASTSNSMDMDESSEDQTVGHHYNSQQQQDYTILVSRNGRHRPSLSHNRNPSIDQMGDIPEDDGPAADNLQQQQQHQSSMPFASTSPPSASISENLGRGGSPGSYGGGKRLDPPMTRSRARQQQQQQQHHQHQQPFSA